jgi:superfamily II DNA helicase RecQ
MNPTAFAFFLIPADASTAAASGLNTFLASHTVLRLTREWCGQGAGGAWAFCVEYVVRGNEPGGMKSGGGKAVDYREVLPPEQFEVFARLREVRRKLADRDGVAGYVIFTNEQLAEMARRGCRSVEDLKGITGIGEARVTKYGNEMLAALAGERVAP